MSWIPSVLSGAATVAGALRRYPRANIGAINSRYRNENVAGYLSPEDQAQVERTRLGGVHAAERGAALTRSSIYRQVTSRGLSGASAAALTLGADQQAAEGRDAASLNADNQGYQLYKGNEEYGREKQMTAWGADINDALRQNQRADLQQSTFWNSALETIPAIMSTWGGGTPGSVSTSTNPADYGGTASATQPRDTGTYNPALVPDRPYGPSQVSYGPWR